MSNNGALHDRLVGFYAMSLEGSEVFKNIAVNLPSSNRKPSKINWNIGGLPGDIPDVTADLYGRFVIVAVEVDETIETKTVEDRLNLFSSCAQKVDGVLRIVVPESCLAKASSLVQTLGLPNTDVESIRIE